MRKLKKVKKSNGQMLAINEVDNVLFLFGVMFSVFFFNVRYLLVWHMKLNVC